MVSILSHKTKLQFIKLLCLKIMNRKTKLLFKRKEFIDMYCDVKLNSSSREILQYLPEPYAEMSENDHAVLCGLLEMYKPKKVVEIGVAGGGTTTIIMKCLQKVNPEAVMYSVDISKECYRRAGKPTGFLLESVRDRLSNISNHTFLLGDIYPNVADKIGEDIDFVILDTVHSLPGEFLDFIAILPFLKNGAVVVLHDVALNLYDDYSKAQSTCNRILMSSIVAEKKYYNFKDLMHDNLPNIGAVVVDERTRKDILNVFLAMAVTWFYIPSVSMLDAYRRFYARFYDSDCIDLFVKIFKNQIYKANRLDFDFDREDMELKKLIKDGVYLYGAGIRGRNLHKYIQQKKGICKGFIISDSFIKKDFDDIDQEILYFSEYINSGDNTPVVIATPAIEVLFALGHAGVNYKLFSEQYYEEIVTSQVAR